VPSPSRPCMSLGDACQEERKKRWQYCHDLRALPQSYRKVNFLIHIRALPLHSLHEQTQGMSRPKVSLAPSRVTYLVPS
jgi:hypothetical protein